MKNLIQKVLVFLLFGLAVLPTQAAFTSLYVFGDSLSATADPRAPGSSYFYGQRWSNGRVWIEVLAQRQGLNYDASNNVSYYDHSSLITTADVIAFKAPEDVSTALFVVWVCNADTFDAAQNHDTPAQWNIANTASQANHLQIITNLYAKGVRNLVLPNAVDISQIPAYNQATSAKTMQDGCIAYNAAFAATINQARVLCPGLKIYTPDFFTLLKNVLTNAPAYGLTNVIANGFSIDAYDDFSLPNPLALAGPGASYIFWDPQDPTAKLHEIMADVAQQIIAPVKISKLALLNGTNRLDVLNYPAGLNGFVYGSTNLTSANWTSVTNITSGSTTQSFFVIASPLQLPPVPIGSGGGSGGIGDPSGGTGTNSAAFPSAAQFYRLQFPYAWQWP